MLSAKTLAYGVIEAGNFEFFSSGFLVAKLAIFSAIGANISIVFFDILAENTCWMSGAISAIVLWLSSIIARNSGGVKPLCLNSEIIRMRSLI